jgi:hypothetical protein
VVYSSPTLLQSLGCVTTGIWEKIKLQFDLSDKFFTESSALFTGLQKYRAVDKNQPLAGDKNATVAWDGRRRPRLKAFATWLHSVEVVGSG